MIGGAAQGARSSLGRSTRQLGPRRPPHPDRVAAGSHFSGSTTSRWIRRCQLFPGFDERPVDEMGERKEFAGLGLASEALEIERDQFKVDAGWKIFLHFCHRIFCPIGKHRAGRKGSRTSRR